MNYLTMIFKILFFVVSALMFIPAKIAYYGGADQKTWVQTQATVIKSELGIRMPVEGEKLDKPTYFWDVEYEYIVDNMQYTRKGIFVTLQASDGNKSVHEQRVNNYPEGSQINVYVNPNNAEQAYIIRRTEGAIESWYNTTRLMFYLSIFLFFVPLIRSYKEKLEARKVKTL